MDYSKSKDLARGSQSEKMLIDWTFEIAINPKYDGYQRGLASMVYNFFDKKSASLDNSTESGVTAPLANIPATVPNYQLENELHRQIIWKVMSRKVYSTFRDNIRGEDLADTQSLSKNNRRIYLLSALNLFSKFAWVIPLKDKKRN